MWVVLVGPHCAGKSTVGKILAQLLGWVFDVEIGDEVIGRSNPVQGIGSNDESILQQEVERDERRKGTFRVVETWHFGNAAWASFRNNPTIQGKMMEAADKAVHTETVHCFALVCNDKERQRRYGELEESMQLSLGPDTLEKTKNISKIAEDVARTKLGDNFRTISTDVLSPQQVACKIHSELFDLVVGPALLFPDFPSARKAVYSASKLLPNLSTILHPDLPHQLPVGSEAFAGLVIVVEGLDGCGKTTIVERLKKHIGSQAIQLKSPPTTLDKVRSVIEDYDSPLSATKAYGRFKRAFYTFGNYVLANELHSFGNPSVVDRFVSSTLSYTFGSTDARDSRPLEPRAVWPDDMPKPDVVLLLDADEKTRQCRIQQRSQGAGIGVGEWEKESERNALLGPSILYHMKHIKNGPPILCVDTNSSDRDQVFRQCALKLVDEGIAVVLRQVVPFEMCEGIVDLFAKAARDLLPQRPFVRYKWDKTNKLYPSRRHSADICFLESPRLTEICKAICHAISEAIGRAGWSVQDDILPVFLYKNGGEIKPHRDVNLTSLDDYCAVLTLSKRRVDFENGAFFVNASASVDSQGQPIDESKTKRQYFGDLDQGDVVVFRNSKCIHGVDIVNVPKDGRGRLSASFRI